MKLRRPPTTPGEILSEEFLEPLGLTQAELAEHIGSSVFEAEAPRHSEVYDPPRFSMLRAGPEQGKGASSLFAGPRLDSIPPRESLRQTRC